MWGGELFVPKIPSYRILDVAKAIAPDAKLTIVGIRPGEKFHEELITVSDAMNTIEFDDYFVIVPAIRDWDKSRFVIESNGKKGKQCPDGFSYDSKTNKPYLTIDELKKLIDENVEL